jgi:hypothetical protein
MCAIDAKFDDLNMLEVAFIPMNHSYQIHNHFMPLHLCMRPAFPVDRKKIKTPIKELETRTMDMVTGSGMVEHWCKQFLERGKKLQPVVYNWAGLHVALHQWMGLSYEECISNEPRDLKTLFNFLKDRMDFWGQSEGHLGNTLRSCLAHIGIDTFDRNSVLANAKGIIDGYQKLLKIYLPGHKE